jgi:hypothetical protein
MKGIGMFKLIVQSNIIYNQMTKYIFIRELY